MIRRVKQNERRLRQIPVRSKRAVVDSGTPGQHGVTKRPTPLPREYFQSVGSNAIRRKAEHD